MTKRKKTILTVFIVFLSLIIALTGVNLTVNQAFYYPNNDSGRQSEAFHLMAETILPMSSLAYVSSASPRFFSSYSQDFSVEKAPFTNSDNYLVSGTFHYRFGNITPKFKTGSKENLCLKQSDFIYDEKKHLSNEGFDANKDYYAYLCFEKAKTIEQVADTFKDFFVKDSGKSILRIMVKTSDNPSDTALFLHGNVNFGILDQESETTDELISGASMNFTNNLHALRIYKEETKALFSSGIFGEEQIDFEKRLNYVSQKPLACMGALIFVKGDILQKMQTKDDMMIIKSFS